MREKEGVNKKFLFLFIFLIAVAAVLLYAKVNFTGFSVLEGYSNQTECESDGYTWEVLTESNCTVIEGCVLCAEGCVPVYTETLCTAECLPDCTNITNCTECAEGCVPAYTETLCTENCETNCTVCGEDIITGGQCTGEICDLDNLDLCLDEVNCTDASGYWYNDECNEEEECIPETCSSLNYECGSISDGCESTLDCGSCSSGYECNSGTCEEEIESTTSSDSTPKKKEIPSTTLVTAPTAPACTPNWQCDGVWGECINGEQIRTCIDSNSCNTNEGMPATSQPCTVVIPETCEDGIKNQDESGIDCGGVCNKCSFFTIVGSAVSGTVDAGKEFVFKNMFGSVLRVILSIGGFVLIIGGFIIARFFLKKKMDLSMLDKVIDNLSNKPAKK